jgi:hypothetical protein
MISQCKTVLLLVALVAASLSAVPAASAATATVTNGPGLGGSSLFGALIQLNNAGKTLSCSGGATISGTVAPSTVGALPLRIGTLTPGFSLCKVLGGLNVWVSCQPAALNVTALTVSGATRGSLTGISCHIYLRDNTACRFTMTGGVGATHFNNPSLLRTDANHQNLAIGSSTNGTGGACTALPNDTSVRYVNTAPTPGDLVYLDTPSNLTINVS